MAAAAAAATTTSTIIAHFCYSFLKTLTFFSYFISHFKEWQVMREQNENKKKTKNRRKQNYLLKSNRFDVVPFFSVFVCAVQIECMCAAHRPVVWINSASDICALAIKWFLHDRKPSFQL